MNAVDDWQRKKRSACTRIPTHDADVSSDSRTPAMNETAPSPKAYATEDARWRAVVTRDAGADGHFVYGVRTTGIYHRPGASMRRPRRENVAFFDSAAAAEAAGYRASRRARSDRGSTAARATLIAQSCRLIEAAEAAPSLDQLAAHAGMSPFHFHRVFKAETGLTPKAYASAHRARRLREELNAPDASVTDAIYGAGFHSSSRFYETSDRLLGMRASDYRAGGAGAEIRFAVGECSLGAILVAQSQRGICAILLGADPEALLRELQDQFPRAHFIGGEAGFERLVAEVVGFVETPSIGLDLPLDVRGTAFQERVWQALREIPPGVTAIYADIAARIGSPRAVRAVAQACGANRIAVAIPCHRVVRRDGDISGYRWGVERKRELLRREADETEHGEHSDPEPRPPHGKSRSGWS
jgi:AraC family transcriptional regulator of adaptative response/methylated-DNA-[protein]-cysteine methyltransferase